MGFFLSGKIATGDTCNEARDWEEAEGGGKKFLQNSHRSPGAIEKLRKRTKTGT